MIVRRFVAAALIAAGLAPTARADSQIENDVKALYRRFVAAQNARDVERVKATLWDAPGFVWISDGKAFWGRDAMIERMSAFQKADVWFVTPDFARARVVEVSPVSAFLHQPLSLTLGAKNDARRIDFLVSVLCVRTPEGWRVAALFTTEENPA